MIEDRKDAISHTIPGEGGTGPGLLVEQQSEAAGNEACALAINLMEKVCTRANLNQAFRRVKSNKGSAGTDGMTVNELRKHLFEDGEQLVQSLLDGSYQAQSVRKVMIPKPGGGKRQLGIPTVRDRFVQQAILQVLVPMYDSGFSESSFGYRPRRSAHGALKQASSHVESGNTWVVDIDLEKFFDRVNHDKLMSKLAKRLGDKRLLKILRGFLTAGIMQDGVVMSRHEGTPQGGPLSPLLTNILLDELDKELERRGHKFCRYADDLNIYVRSKRAGERVYESIKRFLETKLKLQVNVSKSAVAPVSERKFLGYSLQVDGKLTVSKTSLKRLKDKVRHLTWRSRGCSLEKVIERLNNYLRGWLNYYSLASRKSLWYKLDSWIRRKLRCFKLVQQKSGVGIRRLLTSLGVSSRSARMLSSSGKGWWRLSSSEAVHRALNNAWFKEQGLVSLEELRGKLLNT